MDTLWRRLLVGCALLSSVGIVGCARDGVFGGGLWSRPAPAYDPGARQSLRIPGGRRCLEVLGELGVAHERLAPRGRMATPVKITGDIGGVRYRPPLVCDCRLALALHWSAPLLREWNVSEVQHFGAYANRNTRRGNPSLHARGLALDVARFKFAHASQSVEEDFERGLGGRCPDEAPALNQLVCGLRELRLYRELITPDHDADHQDHVHLAIQPL